VQYFPIADEIPFDYHGNVNRMLIKLIQPILLALVALGMGVPVTASSLHDASHAITNVSGDKHHHHDQDGQIAVHDHHEEEAPDGGHEHMPGVLLSAAALPSAEIAIAMPMMARPDYMLPAEPEIGPSLENSLKRPPRLS